MDGVLVVERLIESLSVDFVTYPGAGGAVLALESERDEDRDLIGLIGEKRFRERRPDLVELIESSGRREEGRMAKTIEELQAEVRDRDKALEEQKKATGTAEKERDEASKKVAASEKAEKIAKTKAAVEEALTHKDCKLPDPTKARIRKAFDAAESADGLKERIEAETKYLKEVAAPSRPGGVGPAAGDKKPNLVEAFQRRGLTEEQAKIAAAGRM